MTMPESDTEFTAAVLPSVHSWTTRPTANDLAGLPGCPAVFLFVDSTGSPIQALTTQQLKRVVISRLTEPEEVRRGRADLAQVARGVRWRQVHSAFEARWWYYRLARRLFPNEYRKLVGFGPAWCLHVDWSRPVPELGITERIWCRDGEFVGPWPTQKSCRQALEGLLDLFDLCRYPEQVRRAPDGTRCAYADMGRCDAPCDGSVPLETYVRRCRAAWQFATGEIESWIRDATASMKQAAADQRYEPAGQLKQQIEFASTWQRRWAPGVRPSSELSSLLAIPATRRKAWKLFLFRLGHLCDGPLLPERKLATGAPAWLTEQLRETPELPDDTVRMEQTWLLAHLLQHKEARTAIVIPLPRLEVPPDLEAELRAALERLHAGRNSKQPPPETADVSSDAD